MRGAGKIALALTLAAVAALGGQAAAGSAPAAGALPLELQRIGKFRQPVYVDDAPGFPRLLFVVEQPGRISVLRGGHRLRRPFLDLRERVKSDSNERGLLSIAFPADYLRSRRFYVYYTNENGDIEVDEFAPRAKPSRSRPGVVAAPRSGHPHPGQRNHNGGQLQFGPHGHLYIGTGDGGGAGDSGDNARHLDVLLGKLLRIDPRKKWSAGVHGPTGNPFVGHRRARPEIYAYGLRNPWRFSIDRSDRHAGDRRRRAGPRGGGRLHEDPGGQGSELRLAEARGQHDLRPQPAGPQPQPALPDLSHPHLHARDRLRIIGGYVVHDADCPHSTVATCTPTSATGSSGAWFRAPAGASDDRDTGLAVRWPSSFGEGRRGRIYVASRMGPVYRLKQGP